MKIETCNVELRNREEHQVPAPAWAVGRTKDCLNNKCLCTVVIESGDLGDLFVYPRGHYYNDPHEHFDFRCPNCNDDLSVYYYYPQPKPWWRKFF